MADITTKIWGNNTRFLSSSNACFKFLNLWVSAVSSSSTQTSTLNPSRRTFSFANISRSLLSTWAWWITKIKNLLITLLASNLWFNICGNYIFPSSLAPIRSFQTLATNTVRNEIVKSFIISAGFMDFQWMEKKFFLFLSFLLKLTWNKKSPQKFCLRFYIPLSELRNPFTWRLVSGCTVDYQKKLFSGLICLLEKFKSKRA